MVAEELATVETGEVFLPYTGEVFDLAKPGDALKAISAFRLLEARAKSVRARAEETVIAEALRQGTKTLRMEGLTAKISGGPGATGIDPQKLRDGLRAAGCPEDRIELAIKQTVEEKVDRSVTRQLAMNPDYKKAIDDATFTYTKNYGVSLGQ